MEICDKIGVELGGSKIAAIGLPDSGKVLFEKQIATPQNDYEKVIKSIAELVAQVKKAGWGDASGVRGATRLWE